MDPVHLDNVLVFAVSTWTEMKPKAELDLADGSPEEQIIGSPGPRRDLAGVWLFARR